MIYIGTRVIWHDMKWYEATEVGFWTCQRMGRHTKLLYTYVQQGYASADPRDFDEVTFNSDRKLKRRRASDWGTKSTF